MATPAAAASASGSSSARRSFGMEDFMWGSTLGEGSYARVVHAQLKSNGRHYAIKVMEKRHIRRENKVKQVLTEKHVLSRVAHEFVVKLWFTFQDAESLYLVLDLVTGGELHSVIQHYKERAVASRLGPQRACPWEMGRFYVGEVCLALEYLHGEGVVHRDLKPQNVLISQQGHVKLTDFGSALCLSPDAPQGPPPPAQPPRQSSSTGSGSTEGEEEGDDEHRPHCSFVGTAEYVSPEVLANEPATPGVDMWALGCMAFELLVGEPPFRGRSDYLTFQSIMAHCNGSKPLEYPAHLEAECPQAVDMVRRLLVRDPRERLAAIPPPPPPPPALGGGGARPGPGSYSYSYSYSYSGGGGTGEPGEAAGAAGGSGSEGSAGEGQTLRAHPFFEGFGWERVLSEPPPYVPPPEKAAALLGERLRDGSLEREDWLGLGLGFEEEGVEDAAEPVPLAPMLSFTGGVMMRPASLRRDSEAAAGGEEEGEEGGPEAAGGAAAGLAAAEAALREAAEGPLCPRERTWDQFLDAAVGERCVFTNLVWKRSGLVARRRQLVLTSRGRLLYVDPTALVVKGVIPTAALRVDVRGEHAFDLVTPKRVHHFTDYEVGASSWAAAIRGAQGLGAEEEPQPSARASDVPQRGSDSKGSGADSGRRSLSPKPSPSSSPVRMLPAALAMLGIGTGAGGASSPHSHTEPT